MSLIVWPSRIYENPDISFKGDEGYFPVAPTQNQKAASCGRASRLFSCVNAPPFFQGLGLLFTLHDGITGSTFPR
jgi:hypothetical protein